MSNEYYDDLETRDPEAREVALIAAIREQIGSASQRSAYYRRTLDGVDPAAVTDRAALAALPLTRKSELSALQAAEPPFGGLNGAPLWAMARVFASPGPIFEPEGRRRDAWHYARGLFASGLRPGDLVHNCFSYHFTPAGAMLEGGARALGCPVFAAGTGNTEQQVQAIAHLKPAAYVGTPDYLKIILEKADELGRDCGSIRCGHVSGGAFLPPMRVWYQDRGIEVFQSYGTADVGLIAYETAAREGLVVEENVLLEIVRPGTGDPVPDGEVGEVVVTALNSDYPLIRLATGDLSAILAGPSPCGRTNRRIKGWMGRADQTTKIKGMFVHPQQVAEILRRHPEALRGRLVVCHQGTADIMTLKVETPAFAAAGLAEALAQTLTTVTKLRGGVELVAPGTLANDGKVIDDQRSYG